MGAGLRETKASKGDVVKVLSGLLGNPQLPAVPRELGRDEARAVLRAHELEDQSPQRADGASGRRVLSLRRHRVTGFPLQSCWRPWFAASSACSIPRVKPGSKLALASRGPCEGSLGFVDVRQVQLR